MTELLCFADLTMAARIRYFIAYDIDGKIASRAGPSKRWVQAR